jgi:feruloyl esterase
MGFVVAPAKGQESAALPVSAASACDKLQREDFASLDEAPTTILGTHFVESKDGTVSYCRVSGYVWPQVGFEMILPAANWNGKLFQLGCGGACGRLPDKDEVAWCPLKKGYACITTDTGHRGGDTLWAYYNPQAQNDFGSRGIHVTSTIGKAVAARFYTKAPKYSYFRGCSTGSQQALTEAQRFPGDFNGLIGEGVWIGDIESSMRFIWGARALRGADGKPILTRQQMRMVHQAVLAKCDLNDGLKDGIINNPLSCKFDPAELQCKPGRDAECLTSQQVSALQKMYSGPTTSSGEKLSAGGPFPGGEQNWIIDSDAEILAGDWIMSDGGWGIAERWANTQFRALVLPPGQSNYKLTDLDFDRDYKRFAYGAKESFIHESNPDLRKFKAAGGKLLLSVGWAEWFDPRSAIDYYEMVERVMGGSANTREFARLFLIPGANHCWGGDGAWAIDQLKYMEAWVEHGQAPDKLIGAHIVETPEQLKSPLNPFRYPYFDELNLPIDFTRPIYPYPAWTKYKGSGDPTKAENFVAVAP